MQLTCILLLAHSFTRFKLEIDEMKLFILGVFVGVNIGILIMAMCRAASTASKEIRIMKNPEYFRLSKDGRFVGFKRIVTEYLAAGHSKWMINEIENDEAQKLSRPATGIERLKRESI